MRNKLIAYSLGIVCHLVFVTAISFMCVMLFQGLTQSIFPLGIHGRQFNILLMLQFPILHSFFLSSRGKRLLEAPFPREIARDLSTTTFGLLSSLQLLLVFLFWTPDQHIWFAPSGTFLYFWSAAYAASWALLIVALSEAGMAMHTGSLGWRAVVTGKKPQYPKLSQTGLHKRCRHPIYLSFSLIILTAPVWSFDHFVLAIVWVAYCIIGPLFKEKRLKKAFKSEYESYQQNTPYIFPNAFFRAERAPKLRE